MPGIAGIALGGVCAWLHKQYLLRSANYWFGALVAWNPCVIPVATVRRTKCAYLN